MRESDLPGGRETLLAGGFAQHVERWALMSGASPESAHAVAHAARHLSLRCAQGDVCMALSRVPSDRHWPEDPDQSRRLLIGSGVVAEPGVNSGHPLLLDAQDRLYLHRYFDYERRLALRLLTARKPVALCGAQQATVRCALADLFGGDDPNTVPVTQAGVRDAPDSGGPGTGKTTMVVSLLACLLALDPDCRIALAAPTGKAAARMIDAIRGRTQRLPAELRERLPDDASTIHRLLGVQGVDGRFRYRLDNPLPVDVLIVDEASMLDLSLAVHLLEAVPSGARIVLLGDKDQLAAVESGSVFADLSSNPALSEPMRAGIAALTGIDAKAIQPPAVAGSESGLPDAAVWFTRNFRFSHASPIGRFAICIRDSDAERAMQVLRAQDDRRLRWIDAGEDCPIQELIGHAQQGYRAYFDALLAQRLDPAAVFAAFERFRVLCAIREGRRGVEQVNEALSAALCREQAARRSDRSEWFIGRPVIVSRNDHTLRLFNGDIGIMLPGDSAQPMVFFTQPGGGFRQIAPVRLPPVQTAFAMTVHKAQGSEFDAVMTILPQQANRVLTRELLYTAVTRARHEVLIAGSEPVIRAAIEARTTRQSGLLQRLREAGEQVSG
ncbi:MAG: exodeoxyribonuclease V subunit alpha [Quisquiliibacterium sp.]